MSARAAPKTTTSTRRYTRSRALEVFYSDDGPPTLVGRLVRDQRAIIHFEFDPDWIRTGIELSPQQLPLGPGLFTSPNPGKLHGLFGLFADSLPDYWGTRVLESEFRKLRIQPIAVGALDRLAFLNTRTMGALTYQPPLVLAPPAHATDDLSALSADADAFVAGELDDQIVGATRALDALWQAAGTAGGAQAKVLGGLSPDGAGFISGVAPPAGYTPIIVKFTPRGDRLGVRKDTGHLEEAYARMARAAGIDMPVSRLLRTTDGRRHFAVDRFDRRTNGARRHVHTLGKLFGREAADATDYSEFFAMALALTRDVRVLPEVFRRLYFNVVVLNDDDHSHNHSFILERRDTGLEWVLAPAYDVTFSPNREGVRGMSVSGSETPTWRDMEELGMRRGLSSRQISEIRDEVDDAVARWTEHAVAADVPDASIREVEAEVGRRRREVGRAS